MAVYYVNGNLLEADVQYICHQVNCKGVMGSGIAKQIKDKWPVVFKNYRSKFETINANFDATKLLLGDIQVIALYQNYYNTLNRKYVINMFSQGEYGYDGRKYTSYDAFWDCLNKMKLIPKGSTIGFPDHIGSDRGGANWNVIRTMIEEVLGNDYEVYIYKYEGK